MYQVRIADQPMRCSGCGKVIREGEECVYCDVGWLCVDCAERERAKGE